MPHPVASGPPRVVVYGRGYDDYAIETDVLRPLGVPRIEEVSEGDEHALESATAILVRETPLGAERIATLRCCRAIVRYGIGVDNIDLGAAARRGIFVANVPDYGVQEVATHALALYLAVVRRIPGRDRAVRSGAWNAGAAEPLPPVSGLTLGLVGFGRIGEALHRKARGIGFARTLAYDPYRASWPDDVTPGELDAVLAGADLISLHAPLTPATHHLVDRAGLALVRSGAVIVNTARGGLIDERALADALREGRLFGAGLDVFEQEPPAPDNPLLACDRVVLSDHAAWYSSASLDALHRGAAEEVARVLSGRPPAAWVNRWQP